MRQEPHRIFASVKTSGKRDKGYAFSPDGFLKQPAFGKRDRRSVGFFYTVKNRLEQGQTFRLDIGAHQVTEISEQSRFRELKLEISVETVTTLLSDALLAGHVKLEPNQSAALLRGIANSITVDDQEENQ